MASSKASLEKIVQRAQSLNQNVTLNVPQIRRNPLQLHEASVALASKKPLDERAKSKGQYLLSKKGYDTEKLQVQLSRVELRETFEPVEPLHETDLEGYLQHEHEMLLLTAIEEAKKETIERYNSDLGAYMEDEWEATKRELVSYFSQNEVVWAGAGRGDTGAAGWGQGAAQTKEARRMTTSIAASGEVSEPIKRKLLEYARRVLELNERRKTGKPYPIAFRLGQAAVAAGAGDASQKGIKNCWDLLQSIMSEEVTPTGDVATDPPQEGEYEASRRVQGAPSAPVQKHWLSGSKHFLEEQYWAFIENFVKNQRKDAHIGSMPGKENTIVGFVHVLLAGKPHLDKCEKPDGANPIWAQIYYAMRSGQMEAALNFAKRLGDKSPFYKWISQWKTDPNHTLPADIASTVMTEYRKLSSPDPYKALVFNLIGQCDPMRSHDDIYKFATEDYMWLKLNMVTIDDAPGVPHALLAAAAASSATSPSFGMPSSAPPAFTLSHFQSLITSYGPEHFSNPVLYFQILMLSLQFETAIQFLESTGQFPVETLHFALTLYYYGALHVPEAPLTAPLIGHQMRSPFWNIVRHVTQYIRLFDATNVLASLNYLYLIRDIEVRNLCLRDLITDSEQFALLLGAVHDGTRDPGYLEAFVTQDEWRDIVSLAAVAYEQAGKYEEAMALFDAALYYDKVVDLITKQLSRELTASGPDRQRLVEFATDRYERYDRDMPGVRGHLAQLRGDKAWVTALASFRALLQLCTFFDLYHASRYHEALDIIADLGILPLDNRSIEQCTANFKNLSDPVRRNFADIILATMTCLYRMFAIIKEEGLNAEREAFIRSLKIQAKALVTFTGMINFRIPADTQSKLVRLEASMT